MEISPEAFSKRPELANRVMQIVATWSVIETDLFGLTALFLKADFQLVINMLWAISGSHGRDAAMNAAAKYALSGDELQVFETIAQQARKCRNRRNEFVHNIWGWSEELPDALLLFRHSHIAERMAAVDAYYHRHDPLKTGWPVAIGAVASGDPEWPRINSEEVDVYREPDLVADLLRFERVLHHVRDFREAMGNNAKRAQRFHELQTKLQSERIPQTLPSGSDP